MTIEQRGNHTAVNIVRYAPTVTLVWRKTGFGTIVQQITLQVMTRRICYPTAVTVGEVKWVMILDCFNGRYLTMPIPSGLICTSLRHADSCITSVAPYAYPYRPGAKRCPESIRDLYVYEFFLAL